MFAALRPVRLLFSHYGPVDAVAETLERSAEEILDVQRREHLRMMRELTARKTGGDLSDQLICDFALFHLEADLRWLELTAARLDELAARVTS